MFADDLTWTELDDAEHNEAAFAQMKPVAEVLEAHPWLRGVRADRGEGGLLPLGARLRAGVRAAGRVRPAGRQPAVGAAGLGRQPRAGGGRRVVRAGGQAGGGGGARAAGRTCWTRGTSGTWTSGRRWRGRARTWAARSTGPSSRAYSPTSTAASWTAHGEACSAGGIVGLIHPESHFTEAAGWRVATGRPIDGCGGIGSSATCSSLFEDRQRRRVRCIDLRATAGAAFLKRVVALPAGRRRSLPAARRQRVGAGHRGRRRQVGPYVRTLARIIEVDESVLADWAALIDEPGTPPLEARMLRPVNRSSQQVLDKLARPRASVQCRSNGPPAGTRRPTGTAGYFVGRSAVPESLEDVILQGPHFTVATPYAQQPNPTMRSNKDYTAWDLEDAGRSGRSRVRTISAPSRRRVLRWLSALERHAGEPVLAPGLAPHGRLVHRSHPCTQR